MKLRLVSGLALAALWIASSCAPSPEQIATMTAAAWTPTPPPTPTPTPIPYDLTVHINDEVGTPIAGASIVLPESGSEAPVQTDASGVYTWTGLRGPSVSLTVSAPGYYEAVQALTLEAGATEMALILQHDPLALLEADACASGEKLLYKEDFQSGNAEAWRVTAGDPALWRLSQQEDGNRVASISGVGQAQVELSGFVFENVVWRVRVQATGKDGDAFLNLRHFRAGGDTRYIFQWGVNPFLSVTRFDGGAASQTRLSASNFKATAGRWHFLEVSYYQGMLQAWADGTKQIEIQDPTPLPAGTISIEGHITADPDTAYNFDNMAVCELSAPFASSLYIPPAQ